MANHVRRVDDAQLLKWISSFNNRQGRSPTVREICEGVGYTSPSTVHRRLIQLTQKGLLQDVRRGGRNRDLQVEGRPVGREAHLEDLLAEALGWFTENYPTLDNPRWVLKSRGALAERARRG